MANILIPGRHLVNTRFQEEYLPRILKMPMESLGSEFLGRKPQFTDSLDTVIFAITSSNQKYSRYNPIPFEVRAIGVDRFARQLRETFNIDYRIVGIPHFDPNDRFAEFTLKEIQEQTEGELVLTPENTTVLCATPAVIHMYQKLGFSILPAELASLDPATYRAKLPLDVVKMIVEAGDHWDIDPKIRKELSSATFSLFKDFPHVPRRVTWLYRDPLLTESGGLTATRDYDTYAWGMSNREIMGQKYADIAPLIKTGKIVDEGCSDGALLEHIAKGYPDSDLIGIEITGEFMARCEEKLRAGAFGGTYVHFHQRNLMDAIFEPNSIDTTICNSTTHELWSYGEQQATLRSYLQNKFAQTRKGGRLLIRDVVGPEDKEQEVYMQCTVDDGSNEDIFRQCSSVEELATYLNGLSTAARFKRFAKDFLADMRSQDKRSPETKMTYREETVDGRHYFVLKLKDAVEFMTKKDYTENWQSELNEEFAFWSFSEWKAALHEAGFQVLENPNEPSSSRVYTSPWIQKHRWEGKVTLYRNTGHSLELLPYPVTNIVLAGENQ